MGVEAGSSCIVLVKSLPVSLFVVLIDVLVQRVGLSGLCKERHHTRHKYEYHDPHCEDVCCVAFVGFTLVYLWSHVPLRARVSVEDAY